MATARIPAEERLFSLVLALLATDSGLTKHEILSTVQGYAQRFVAGGDNATLERQFERDKDEIRELGVPLETVEAAGEPGNNQNLRYRIPRGEYEFPTDVTFSPEETTLLNLAAVVWREGSMSAESARALLKLRSLGLSPTEPVVGYAPRVRVRDAAFEPLSIALQKSVAVTFSYLKPGQATASERTVEPLALFQHEGRWHLFARVPGSNDTRTYLLRRIVSKVAILAKQFVPPAGDQAALGLAGVNEVWNSHVAEVRVEPDSDAETRLLRRRGSAASEGNNVTLHYADAAILADELAAMGPEVLVISPPELRAAVRERLRTVRAQHEGDS
ncbi:helix-turn-helix transcriptional regulator [Salinibacterium hongtaonis]|uniref:WYL domain-containing protein n=1 Tax=Homoserinimonas hongtaonis TaxID=2079791 RepID=A0A2U1SYC0_9MICO|nr:WYL domain-containing protein [Salinibacterium hongtaonis]AWB89150.1 WYL domain-containing protein [Salinibacterium hongtaonis]PWB96598.1 WYL domain-containing protein [Salinibacterium hongtaonis]